MWKPESLRSRPGVSTSDLHSNKEKLLTPDQTLDQQREGDSRQDTAPPGGEVVHLLAPERPKPLKGFLTIAVLKDGGKLMG